MSARWLFLICLLGAIAPACLATEAADNVPPFSFAPFPLPLARTDIDSNTGTPASRAELESPYPNDYPPCLTIGFETGKGQRFLGGRYMRAPRNLVRIYNIAEAKTATYVTIRPAIEGLGRLLAARPETIKKAVAVARRPNVRNILPDYPPRNATHLVEAKMTYIDAPWGSGIIYVTQFVQGLGEVPDSEQLLYLFQGLSEDKRFFISAEFQINHPKVFQRDEEVPADRKKADVLTAKIEKELEKASDDSFTPSLRILRDWIATFKIKDP